MSKSDEHLGAAMTTQPEKILPGDYPAMLEPKAGETFLHAMREPATRARAQLLMASRAGEIGNAILDYIKALEATPPSDHPAIFAHAHEIRGLAAVAGMTASGKIADGLCKYLDVCMRSNIVADAQVLVLHKDAIALSARATDDATRTGTKISEDLLALTAHALQATQRPKSEQS